MTNSKLIYIEDDQILGNLITQALVDYGFEIDFRTTLNGLQESLASATTDHHSFLTYGRSQDRPQL